MQFISTIHIVIGKSVNRILKLNFYYSNNICNKKPLPCLNTKSTLKTKKICPSTFKTNQNQKRLFQIHDVMQSLVRPGK